MTDHQRHHDKRQVAAAGQIAARILRAGIGLRSGSTATEPWSKNVCFAGDSQLGAQTVARDRAQFRLPPFPRLLSDFGDVSVRLGE